MKQIQLTQGKFATVDDADFDWLNQWKWCFDGRYAVRSEHIGESRKNRTSKKYYLHRELLNGKTVDHINGDRLDNRRCNIRLCTSSQNSMNSIPRQGASSKYKGVGWHSTAKKWESYIQINGKKKYLGVFDCEIDAAKTYNAVAVELFGEFAKVNNL